MIEKMKFVSISGPKNDLDRMVNQYLSHYEIQLENALTELRSASKLDPLELQGREDGVDPVGGDIRCEVEQRNIVV